MSAREIIAGSLAGRRGRWGGPIHKLDYDDADSVLSALSAAGLVIVPAEPTKEMNIAGAEHTHIWLYEADRCYRAMLAARPTEQSK